VLILSEVVPSIVIRSMVRQVSSLPHRPTAAQCQAGRPLPTPSQNNTTLGQAGQQPPTPSHCSAVSGRSAASHTFPEQLNNWSGRSATSHTVPLQRSVRQVGRFPHPPRTTPPLVRQVSSLPHRPTATQCQVGRPLPTPSQDNS
jgi:hypothetical protein